MPASIGPFTNVPVPGDPLTSAWAQQLTTYAVAAARLAGATSAGAGQVVNTGTFSPITGAAVSWTNISGHRYLMLAFTGGQATTANALVNLAITTTDGATNYGSAGHTAPVANAQFPFALMALYTANNNNANTAQVRAAVNTGSWTLNTSTVLAVIDLGP